MHKLLKAKFMVQKHDESTMDVEVQYNPNTLTISRKPKVVDIPIPGLDAPLKQFVRGDTETLTVELFFDTTSEGMDSGKGVHLLTDQFYSMVKIDPKTHAIPICTFVWGQQFPGAALIADIFGGQRRSTFTGLITDIKQEFKLFDRLGAPLRAILTLTMNAYKPLHEQIKELNLQSPDHTRAHTVGRGETLASVSWQLFQNPTEWRHIADSNGIDDPRRLEPGRTLLVPPLD